MLGILGNLGNSVQVSEQQAAAAKQIADELLAEEEQARGVSKKVSQLSAKAKAAPAINESCFGEEASAGKAEAKRAKKLRQKARKQSAQAEVLGGPLAAPTDTQQAAPADQSNLAQAALQQQQQQQAEGILVLEQQPQSQALSESTSTAITATAEAAAETSAEPKVDAANALAAHASHNIGAQPELTDTCSVEGHVSRSGLQTFMKANPLTAHHSAGVPAVQADSSAVGAVPGGGASPAKCDQPSAGTKKLAARQKQSKLDVASGGSHSVRQCQDKSSQPVLSTTKQQQEQRQQEQQQQEQRQQEQQQQEQSYQEQPYHPAALEEQQPCQSVAHLASSISHPAADPDVCASEAVVTPATPVDAAPVPMTQQAATDQASHLFRCPLTKVSS